MGRGGFVCMSSTMRVALTRKREGYEKWGRRLWHWLPFVNRAWPENKKGSCVNSKKKKERKIDRVLYMGGMAKESPVGSGPSFASSVAHVTHREAQLRNVYGLCHFWSFLYRREKQNKWVRKNEKKFKSKERKERCLSFESPLPWWLQQRRNARSIPNG